MKTLILASLLLPFAAPAHADGPGHPVALDCFPADDAPNFVQYGLEVTFQSPAPVPGSYSIRGITLIAKNTHHGSRPQKYVLDEISQDSAAAVYSTALMEIPPWVVRFDKQQSLATISLKNKVQATCTNMER